MYRREKITIATNQTLLPEPIEISDSFERPLNQSIRNFQVLPQGGIHNGWMQLNSAIATDKGALFQ
jgi:hypothetical protein